MDDNEFREWSLRAAEWGADYRKTLSDRPVRAQTQPGEVLAKLSVSPPEGGEPMADIFADFESIILPGMTHWQHPRFFAYFPANSAPVSAVAEYLATAIAAQCMLWQTSPAATELETLTTDWLRQAVGLPDGFHGVLQDTASSATLAAVLTMREKALAWQGNTKGLKAGKQIRVYCSTEVHSSIDRAIWIAGIGEENLVKIPVSGEGRGMRIDLLEAAIETDRAAGLLPAGIVACVGGTGVGGSDDCAAVCAVAARHGLYVHVDAAWAGSAMICPEFRSLWAGAEDANSIVFNPHKWLGAQFDCCAHFVREPEDLVRTLAIRPAYLKTQGKDGIINYSEWSVTLGRRFRALKLWFLIRYYGLEGLRTILRNHVRWTEKLCEKLRETQDFEITSEPVLALFSFRYLPQHDDADAFNQRLLETLNDDGRIYLTQTVLDGRYVIRFTAGSFLATEADFEIAFKEITGTAKRLAA